MEIGGDFWLEEIQNRNNKNQTFFNFGQDNRFVLSGRTAIDIAIQDILAKKQIKNVYFPSYCCDSMSAPFIDRNIKVDYYDVYFENTLKYNIDTNFECDIFFAMNYFGYTSTNMEKYIEQFRKKGIIVIEDATQSLLSEKPFSLYSNYVVASLRKWFPIMTGGLVSNLDDYFDLDFNTLELNNEVTQFKSKAMKEKRKYINLEKNEIEDKEYSEEYLKNKEIIKENFLKNYKASNIYIEKNYINKKMDDKSLNILLNINLDKIIEKRRKNTKEIYKNLHNENIKYLIKNYNEEKDCLLYLPVYMKKEYLEKLKK